MTISKSAKFNILFVILSLIWGLTWIPIKLGIALVEPTLFAATRFIAAGIILLLISNWRYGSPLIKKKDQLRLLTMAMLVCAISYSLVYWGMLHIDSGLAALFNLAFIPISFMFIAFFLGEERLSAANIRAVLAGTIGLLILFKDDLGGEAEFLQILGSVAAAAAALIYCFGSMIGKPLLKTYHPITISGWTNLLGGAALLIFSFLFQSSAQTTAGNLLDPMVLLSLGFLIVFGSVVAFTIFLTLINEYSATETGMYAFVSPVIAIMAGIAFMGENVEPLDFLGIAFLLTSAAAVLFRENKAAPTLLSAPKNREMNPPQSFSASRSRP